VYKTTTGLAINNNDLYFLRFYSVDSTMAFSINYFDRDDVFLFGPIYLPIIPFFIYPILYFTDGNHKLSDYNILVYCSDSININDFSFYRNGKKTYPISTIASYKYNEMQDSCFLLKTSKYYSVLFKYRIYTTKEIEIKYKEKTLLQIKRKKKLYHKIIFAH
jgi:hypothetical protein